MTVSRLTYPMIAGNGRGVLRVRAAREVKGLAITVLRSLSIFLPVFFVATFVTFALRALSGLSPATVRLGEYATPEAIARVEHEWGLDRPFLDQYWTWLSGVLHGDLGLDWVSSYPVATLIGNGLTTSASIAVLAMIIGILGGLGLGTLAYAKQTTWVDRTITAVLSGVQILPSFIAGILLITVFSVWLDWLPSAGFTPLSAGFWPWLSHLLLPGFALGLHPIADVARQLRTGLITEGRANYVTGAIVRGLSPRRVFFRHVLRNGIGPTVAILGLEFPSLIGGAVITESIFALAGVGQFANKAAQAGNVPAVQGVLVLSIVLVVIFNLIVNVILGRITPAAQRGV